YSFGSMLLPRTPSGGPKSQNGTAALLAASEIRIPTRVADDPSEDMSRPPGRPTARAARPVPCFPFPGTEQIPLRDSRRPNASPRVRRPATRWRTAPQSLRGRANPSATSCLERPAIGPLPQGSRSAAAERSRAELPRALSDSLQRPSRATGTYEGL